MDWCREYKYVWDVLYLKCTKCWERKTKDAFHKSKIMKFWVKAKCKDCRKYLSREYRKSHKDIVKRYNSIYNKSHKEYLSKYNNYLDEMHSDDLWFSWSSFHEKTKYYVLKHKLRPYKCSICWECGMIETHHPSYNSFDEWSKVVFCCRRCHKNIHAWNIKCPDPINLLELV